ncbi:MAG: 16S rRNA (cytosine(967)-C(5))-methyltransferase RsmB [Clostridia bacterium]|nr:16S rRNA (cytosine(967)-C(5))-methyltransferase RsmB [Clostridia bacterium]MBQ7789509.1 16S rRNA (cytosine(967)-C(5))-methyltransferase RsmB [Clostridia bacterium]
MLDNPRALALSSLLRWEGQGSFSNIEINTTISRSSLEKNDISLYTLLFMGVIEKKLFLDNVIKQYSNIPLERIDIETKNVLRLGIYQLVFTDKIPEYSAVDQSVSLAPKKSKGFVNALLRSFIRNERKITYPKDKWQRISIEYSVPMDVCQIFKDSYGETVAEELCTLPQPKTEICLRVNTLKSTIDNVIKELSARGIEQKISSLSSDIVMCHTQISAIKDLLDSGYVFVQDEASRIASAVVGAKKGEKIADVCACPGGKTFSMAMDMQNEGEIYASDLHENKLSLITRTAKRLGIDIIKTREQNAKEFLNEYSLAFDRVLCDVPCSGLGVIFKKPDIKYKSLDNIRNLPSVQYDILNNCSKYVKMGGILVYSTCTINKAENEDNIEKFLSEHSEFEPLDFEIGNIKSVKGGYTFLPHINGTDGFFVARMKKIK